jgi:hypothetical protein
VHSCHEPTLLCVGFAIWSTGFMGLTAPSDEVVGIEGIAGASSRKKRLLHKRRAKSYREMGDREISKCFRRRAPSANGQRVSLSVGYAYRQGSFRHH